ncbi:MAG TPA: methionyl-tRNA formyltransferase [Chitinophagales bacterium]|nr:methionyl-tRNA formyltransferase [Chitinophagales bacterium]
MRLIFMGTPEFAVPSLEILLKNGYDIAAVVTAPDKPAGRGLKMSESAVKKFASANSLKILQPHRLKDPLFLDELKSLKPDLQVVVAFRMLPEEVWRLPPLGTINLHASLLPDYRGAAPINWAIINGETETGLTTFYIEKDLDTGKIIFQEKMEIGFEETAGELHNRMKQKGAELILKTVIAIEKGAAPSIRQPESSSAKKAPKLTHEICQINWNLPTLQIFNHIRGLSPYPGAWTLLDGKVFKIYRAGKFFKAPENPPGTFLFSDKELRITAQDGYIIPKEVQLEGKKKMGVEEFLRGYNRN